VLRIGAAVSERYGKNVRANRAAKATKLHRSKAGTITISIVGKCGGKKAREGREASASFLKKSSQKLCLKNFVYRALANAIAAARSSVSARITNATTCY
jgi:hypothetical protein